MKPEEDFRENRVTEQSIRVVWCEVADSWKTVVMMGTSSHNVYSTYSPFIYYPKPPVNLHVNLISDQCLNHELFILYMTKAKTKSD